MQQQEPYFTAPVIGAASDDAAVVFRTKSSKFGDQHPPHPLDLAAAASVAEAYVAAALATPNTAEFSDTIEAAVILGCGIKFLGAGLRGRIEAVLTVEAEGLPHLPHCSSSNHSPTAGAVQEPKDGKGPVVVRRPP